MLGDLENQIEKVLECKIVEAIPISLQDSSGTFEILTTLGTRYFYKWIEHESALDILAKEKSGLEAISLTESCPTPGLKLLIGEASKAGLILEWIDRKMLIIEDQEQFGRALSRMHRHTHSLFGYHDNNYISILAQDNSWTETWSSFYASKRIEPLLKIAVDKKILQVNDCPSFESLEKVFYNSIPQEKPSFIHGDLWSGNYIMSSSNKTYLIDPAVYYGHREMDLAMSLMFGSFGRPFYSAYTEAMPLANGFQQRIPFHQLYPLLVHAILFQGHYIQQVKDILCRM